MVAFTAEQFGEYLADLLIIQYRNKKCFDTIKALSKMIPLEIVQEVMNCFNVETAVGKQLDILGKYVFGDSYLGQSRAYEKIVDGISVSNMLTDEEYRKALLLKIILNCSSLTNRDIDEDLYSAFGKTIRADSENDMSMVFYITQSVENVFLALMYNGYLPRPAGISFTYLVVATDDATYGYCTYDELPTPSTYLRTGFMTYDDLEKDGDFLTYDKLQRVRT